MFSALVHLFRRGGGQEQQRGVNEFEELFRSNAEQLNATSRDIRRCKRRRRILQRRLLTYGVVAFLLLLAVVYAQMPSRKVLSNRKFLVQALFVALFPILLYYLRSLVEWYFNRRINNLEEHLESLKLSKDDKLAEFKKLTNFSKLRELVHQYDERSEDPNLDENTMEREDVGQFPPLVPASPALSRPEDVSQLRERGVLDRVLDYLLNDGPNNRFALICEMCCTHNGLVLPEDLYAIQYRCPVCGHLNSHADAPLDSFEEDDAIEEGNDADESKEQDVHEEVTSVHLTKAPSTLRKRHVSN